MLEIRDNPAIPADPGEVAAPHASGSGVLSAGDAPGDGSGVILAHHSIIWFSAR